MKRTKSTRSGGARRQQPLHTALVGLRKPNPKRAAIKRRVKRQRPLHKRILLHPVSIMAVLCAGVFITGWTYHAIADFYSLTAKVAAPPLTQGAVITSPSDGAVFKSSPISVTGTCPAGSYVNLDRNGAFSGVANCASDNTFSISTDLFAGQNTLQAQDYNVTNDPGPVTPSVNVTYEPPAPPPSSGSSSQGSGSGSTTTSPSTGSQTSSSGEAPTLLLSGNFHYQMFVTGRSYSWNLELHNGKAPFKVITSWGDGTSSTANIPSQGMFTISHIYQSYGYYTVLIHASDSTGQVSVLQLVAVVRSSTRLPNGTLIAGTTGKNCSTQSSTTSNCPAGTSNASSIWNFFKNTGKLLMVAWPSFIIVSLMLVSYVLGEHAKIAHLHK